MTAADILQLPGLGQEDRAAGVGEGEASAPAARVIGIDPSLTGTGISDGTTTWIVSTTGKADDDLIARRARLGLIARKVCAHVPADTALVVIEGPDPNSRTGHAHDRSGLWWLVVSSLMAAGIPVAEVPPSSLKKYATDKGQCKKELVVDQTARRYPHVITGADNNRCDALWLAAMGIDHLTGVHVVPESQRAALKAIRWPA